MTDTTAQLRQKLDVLIIAIKNVPDDNHEYDREKLLEVFSDYISQLELPSRSKPDEDCSNWAKAIYQGYQEHETDITAKLAEVVRELKGET